MPPTRATAPIELPKKRRTFFASKIPALEVAAAPTRTNGVSSEKVLAALLPPRAVEPPERAARPRREPKEPKEPKDSGGDEGSSGSGRKEAMAKGKRKEAPRWWKGDKGKSYMTSGLYCQDADAESPNKLVNKVLKDKETFPPLPYDHGYDLFFGKEHEFVLPYNIQTEVESGALDGKKKPTPYQKIRGNVFPERSRYVADVSAVCKCAPKSGCGEKCINRIMHYLCGRDCPCGEGCTNKSLAKRKGPAVKVVYTGSRGFGLMAMEDIKAGEFVIDYRGEVIPLEKDYVNGKNFYALAYDQGEVIDAGMRGNEARFINHGCQPNLEVRKFQTLGDGMEEFEVGMWADRDIKAGEELFYDYNFDSFNISATNDMRTKCRCGAENCVGFLGRQAGERSAKAIAADLEKTRAGKSALKAKKAAKEAVQRASGRSKIRVGKTKPAAKVLGRLGKAKTRGTRKNKGKVVQSQVREKILQAQTKVKKRKSVARVGPEVPRLTSTFPKRPLAEYGPPKEYAPPRPATPPPVVIPAAPPTPTSAEDAAKKARISGWAEWLRKKAGEKARTRDEWEDFALARRRGRQWMERMMAEYGVAEYPGGPAMPYMPPMPLPPPGQPQRRGPPPGTPRPPRLSKDLSETPGSFSPGMTPGHAEGSGFAPMTYGVMERGTGPSMDRYFSREVAGSHPYDGGRGAYPQPYPSVLAEPNGSPSFDAMARTNELVQQKTMEALRMMGRGDLDFARVIGRGNVGFEGVMERKDIGPDREIRRGDGDFARVSEASQSTAKVPPAKDANPAPLPTPALTERSAPDLPVVRPTPVAADGASAVCISKGVEVPLESKPAILPIAPTSTPTLALTHATEAPPIAESSRGEKKAAIAKRNGAPMGWAFVPADTPKPSRAAVQVEDVGPRSARKGRASIMKDADLRRSLLG